VPVHRQTSKRRRKSGSAFRHSPRDNPLRAGLSPQSGSGWSLLLHVNLLDRRSDLLVTQIHTLRDALGRCGASDRGAPHRLPVRSTGSACGREGRPRRRCGRARGAAPAKSVPPACEFAVTNRSERRSSKLTVKKKAPPEPRLAAIVRHAREYPLENGGMRSRLFRPTLACLPGGRARMLPLKPSRYSG